MYVHFFVQFWNKEGKQDRREVNVNCLNIFAVITFCFLELKGYECKCICSRENKDIIVEREFK